MKQIFKGKNIHYEKKSAVRKEKWQYNQFQLCKLVSFSKKIMKNKQLQKMQFLDQSYSVMILNQGIQKLFESSVKINKTREKKKEIKPLDNLLSQSSNIVYQIYILIQKAQSRPMERSKQQQGLFKSYFQTISRLKAFKFQQKIVYDNMQNNWKKKSLQTEISLRGGGCGASKAQKQVEKLQQKPENTAQIPLNFLTDLNKYLEIVISKAPFASDGQQKDEILIALQWFIVMKEHFNSLCLDSKSASSVFDLIFKSVPQLLKSLIIYIRISGFLCLQVLQIINDLNRVLFTFYMKNQNRYMDIKDREQLDELISEFETQLDIESSNIWVGGAQFEVAMIKAVIQSSPNNSEEGQKLLKTFLGGLAQSILTMSPSDDLIDSLIEGAKFLWKENKVRNLKKNYEVYYYFESLKWYMIQLLRQDVLPKRALQLLQKAFKNYVENSKEWLLNFCWVKLISDLLSYRPIIKKQELSINAIEQQKIWNQLIKYKFINQCSFNKGLGRLTLFQEQQNQETQELNQIIKRIGMRSFQIFSDLLLNSLQYSQLNLFTFKNKIENQQKKIDYLFGLYQENSDLSESVENLNQQSTGLKQLFEKTKKGYEKWKNLTKEKDQKQRNLQLDEIVENTQDLIKQCFYTFTVSLNIYKTFQLYFERSKLILNSIEQVENTIKQEMEGVENMFYKDCLDKLNSQENKLQLIDSLVTLEVNFNQIKLEAINHQQITEKFEIILQFFNCIDQFIKPFEMILKKIQVIYDKQFKNQKLSCQKYNEEVQLNVLLTIGEKIFDDNNLAAEQDLCCQLIQSALNKQDQGCIYTELIIYHKIKYCLINFMGQLKQQKEIINNILIFISKNNSLLCIFQYSDQQNNDNKNFINELLEKQFQLFQQFFRQEGKLINSDQINNQISIEKLLQILRNDLEQLEEMQNKFPENKILIQVRFAISIVEQYLSIYIETPQRINIIKEQILQIYKNNNENLMEQNNTISIEQQNQKMENLPDNQNNELLENMHKNYTILKNQLETKILASEVILDNILDKIKLYESFQHIEIQLNCKLNNNKQFSQIYEDNQDLILQEQFEQFKVSKLSLDDIKLGFQQQKRGNFMHILLSFCDLLRPRFSITINVDMNIFQKAVGKVSAVIEEAKGLIEDENYKARQCYVISLMSAQTIIQEKNMIQFCQDGIVQIWTTEKDERVKSLLKNTEFLEMQKNIFKYDLNTFSKRLQLEMEERLYKISEIEEKIYLEGDSLIRQQMQEELQAKQIEFEDYLENINDMAGKLDIGIQFLKDIKRSLTQLKQKIDKLSDTVKEIGDDIRKLRGKTFQELLNIRRRKVLEQMQLSSLNQIYIPLQCQEWDPILGQQIGSQSILLHDILTNQGAEINEFLHKNQQDKDVLLLRGVAGSGKSRAARKIEEFLWQKIDSKESNWIPIYVSLPTLKEPKFNLIDQALETDYYQFDKIQVKEFKEAIDQGKLKIILILDSYDEMKQECLQQNLYQSNRFQKDLFGSIQDVKRVKEFLKVIITTRTEILTSNSYQTWFYGDSLQSLKEVELLGFDLEQQQRYLEQYAFQKMKIEFLEIYTFMKQMQKEKNSFEEFCNFWGKIYDFLEKNPNTSNQDDLLVNSKQVKQLIFLLKEDKLFQKLNKDQIINLQKKLMELWSSNKFKKLIASASIQNILTTPFMIEIVVQVLPGMTQKYSDSSLFKDQFIQNYIQIKQSIQIENSLIQKYQNKRLMEEGLPEMIVDSSSVSEKELKQQVLTIWDQLQNQKFFQRFSLVDKITKDNLQEINEVEIVIRALIVKQLTVFDFYMTFVEFYHQKQIKKQQELGRMINYESFMIDLFNFSQSLAIHLTKNELTQIKYVQKGQLVLKYANQQFDLKENWMDAYFDDFKQNADYKKLVRSCILITQKGGSHSFTHKSIQEFYVGHFLLKLLHDIKIINEDDYQTQIKDLNIQNLMAQLKQKNSEQQYVLSEVEQLGYSIYNSLINKNSFNLSSVNYKGVLSLIKNEMKLQLNLKQKLLQIVKLSQTSDCFIRASSNSLYLLSYNNEFLGNLELKNIKISDIQLIGVSFYGSNMENSQFSNVGISSCNFSKTNMKNAQWKNIQCDELHSLENNKRIYSIVFSKNGQTIVSAQSDQIVFWDIKNGGKIISLQKSELLRKSKFEMHQSDFSIEELIAFPNDLILAIRWYMGRCQEQEDVHSAVQLVDFKTGRLVSIQFFENNKVHEFIISSDNTTLALRSDLLTIELQNIQENKWTSLSGHKKKINSIFFTPDNQRLVSCSQDSQIIFWNLGDRTILTQVIGHEYMETISLSLDGSTLAYSSGNILKIWNISKQDEIKNLVGHNSSIECLKFLPDRQSLVSWGRDEIILIWDTIQGKQIRKYRFRKGPVSFSPNYVIMAFQTQNEIELWDIQVGKKISEIGGQSNSISILAFQPPTEDGSEILASVENNDSTIKLWDTKIQNKTIKLDGHKSRVKFIGFSLDGLFFYSYGQDNTIRLWSSKEGRLLQSLENIKNLQQIKFSSKGEFLFLSGNQVYFWYYRENRLVTINEEKQKNLLPIKNMIVSQNKQMLGWFFQEVKQNDSFKDPSFLNKIKLFDINLNKQVALLELKSKSLKDIFFSPNCQFLVSLEQNGHIELWDLKTYKSLFTLEDVKTIIFSPNSRIICAYNKKNENKVSLLNLQLLEIANIDYQRSIQFSPDSRILATLKEKQIILWNSEDGQQIAILSGHQQDINQFQFSPNGSIIASCAHNEKIIYLWDIQECKLFNVLDGHSQDILGFAFSSNGEILASYSNDCLIIIWNYLEGKQITVIKEHVFAIEYVLFSPNDRYLVECDTNYSQQRSYQVLIWDLAKSKKITMFKSQMGFSCFTFSPDSKTLNFIEGGQIICVQKLQENENIKKLQGHRETINNIVFSLDGSILISLSISYPSCILLWDMSTYKLINIIEGDRAIKEQILLSNDDQKLAINYGDRQIRLYDSETGEQTAIFEEHKHLIEQILFSSDSNLLASCSRDFTIKLWDVKDVKKPLVNAIASLEGIIDFFTKITFSPNSQQIFSLGRDLTIQVWDVQTKQQKNQWIIQKYGFSDPYISSIQFSSNQKYFAYCVADKIYVRKYQDQSLYLEYEIQQCILQGETIELVFGKQGKWLILQNPNRIYIFDLEQKILLRNIDSRYQFQFILDWKILCFIQSQTIKFWDVQKDQEIAIFNEHTSYISQFSISPDNLVIATCSGDTTIKLTPISDILALQENQKNPKILSSFKTIAIQSPMTAFECQIQGASIKSSMDWNMKQLFIQKGAVEQEM